MILRKDSWSHEEDTILIDTVFQFARERKKQVEAFNWVALYTGRTFAAVQYRWHREVKNSPAVKQYRAETAVLPAPKAASANLTFDQCVTLLQLPALPAKAVHHKLREMIGL